MPIGPAPMEGHGAYNRDSRVQAAGSSRAVPLLAQAAAAVPLPADAAPVVIADYGASEGHNSLVPIGRAIAALRARIGPQRPAWVMHTDLPSNDFTALFETLDQDPESYLRNDPQAFAFAVGRSFYGPILPAQSVTLGWSSWAVQWLSRIPGPIPDQVQIAFSKDSAARAAYARQAAEDWRAFLACRARELVPGGRLVVLTMASDDAGSFGYDAVVAAIYDALQDLVAQGLVRADEAHRMAIPTVGRSRADLLAPFAGGRYEGLSVASIEVFRGEDRIWEQCERDGDALAFGKRWAAFSRASVFPTLALGLDGGDADQRTGAFSDRMEMGMAERLAAAPGPTNMPLASVVIVKEPA